MKLAFHHIVGVVQSLHGLVVVEEEEAMIHDDAMDHEEHCGRDLR